MSEEKQTSDKQQNGNDFITDVSSSVISELSEEQQFYITLISRLNSELITEQIITPMQKSQIEKYILGKIQ